MASAISETKICNLALVRLGEKMITSLSDDSQSARICDLVYGELRDELLCRYRWKFAIHRKSVTADSASPEHGYDYQYSVPSSPKCLRILKVEVSETELTDWVREGDKILTDGEDETIDITYIRQVTDEAKFPNSFVKALAMSIAEYLAYNLIQSSTAAERVRLAHDDAILQARIQNELEDWKDEAGNTDWQDEGR
jgi:hypothetical protein